MADLHDGGEVQEVYHIFAERKNMNNKWLMILVSLLLIEIVGMCLVIPTESAKAKKEMGKVVDKQKCSSAYHQIRNNLKSH